MGPLEIAARVEVRFLAPIFVTEAKGYHAFLILQQKANPGTDPLFVSLLDLPANLILGLLLDREDVLVLFSEIDVSFSAFFIRELRIPGPPILNPIGAREGHEDDARVAEYLDEVPNGVHAGNFKKNSAFQTLMQLSRFLSKFAP